MLPWPIFGPLKRNALRLVALMLIPLLSVHDPSTTPFLCLHSPCLATRDGRGCVVGVWYLREGRDCVAIANLWAPKRHGLDSCL